MPSDRMMEAVSRLDRALSRIEYAAERAANGPVAAETAPIDTADAAAALRSLDALIADLKGTSHG